MTLIVGKDYKIKAFWYCVVRQAVKIYEDR